MGTFFLALPVSDSVARALPAMQKHYDQVVDTPTPNQKLHLTLLWLGSAEDTTSERRRKLVEPLRQSFVPTVRLTHVGRGRQRDQLWAYSEAAGPLVAIREQLMNRLRTISWSVPKQEFHRIFTPHITIAKLYAQASQIGLADHPFITSYCFSEVLLYKSEASAKLKRVYSIIERIALA